MVIADSYIGHSTCAYCACVPSEQVFATSEDDCYTRYCSSACMAADAAAHSLEQNASLYLIDKGGAVVTGPMDALRLTLRVAAECERAASAGVSDASVGATPSHDHVILGLDAAGQDARLNTQERRVMDDVAAFVAKAYAALGPKTRPLASKVLHDAASAKFLFFAIQCNAHQVVDNEGRPVALGLFPLVSMLNHSCAPSHNAEHFFSVTPGHRPLLQMRATRDLIHGEEVNYSYLPHHLDYAKRRETLLKGYGFECGCTQCTSDMASHVS